jgi:hypothetical protein
MLEGKTCSLRRAFTTFSSNREVVSGDERFEPVRQFHEFELARLLGTIKGIAHDDLAQFGHRVDVAEHAVEQVEQPLQVVVGIACWTRAKGFEQAFALRWRDLLHAFHHMYSYPIATALQNSGSKT